MDDQSCHEEIEADSLLDQIADAWAMVLIDVYEKGRGRGTRKQPRQGDGQAAEQ